MAFDAAATFDSSITSPTFKNDPDTYFSSVEIPKASASIASFTVVFKSSNSSDVGDRLSVCEPVSLWYYIPLNRSYSCQYYTYFAYPGDLSSEKGPLHRDSDHQSNSLFDSTLTDGRSHDAFYMSIHINKTGRNDITRASIF